MAFTPENIKQKEFSRVHKGLDESEVRQYLESLSDEIEKLKSEKAQLQTLIDDKDENINRFRAVETQFLKQYYKLKSRRTNKAFR